MDKFFYPSPNSTQFTRHSWESWNKLKSSINKKSLSFKPFGQKFSKSPPNNPSFSIYKTSNPIIRKNKSQYKKYYRQTSGQILTEPSPPTVRKQDLNITCQGLIIQLKETKTVSNHSSRARAIGSRCYFRPTSQGSCMRTKQVENDEALSPW